MTFASRLLLRGLATKSYALVVSLLFALTTTFLLPSSAMAQASHATDVTLTPEESERLAEAREAVMKTPEMKAAFAKFNAARKLYQQDRQKFAAERDKEVAIAFRKATKEFEGAKQMALLSSDPTLKPLLDREAALKKASRHQNEGEELTDSDSPRNPAIRQAQEIPGLPRVLLIGDSISIGYTLQVRRLLAGKANVQRIPINGGATEVGISHMAKWLGDAKWDVIHFNFGLHDAKQVSQTRFRSSRDQYRENLERLISLMKPTGAKLIFATTTPVPHDGVLTPTRRFDDIAARNEIAKQVMVANGVAIDDLYSAVLPRLADIGRTNDVHFKPEGYEVLAKSVAATIEAALPTR
jgi:lysophospholipase L1-like esterase